jgi:hypothetical protein
LSAVRDALLELGRDKDAKSVEDDFLFMYDRRAQEKIPRLAMNTDDQQFMWECVLCRPAERTSNPSPRFHSHGLIREASAIASERVEKIMAGADSVTGKVDAINAWIDFIDRCAIVVLLTPPNAARAFQMFKTLNDRAQRTTQADMVKNHLFEQADDRVDEAQSKWSAVRTIVEPLDIVHRDDPLLTYLHTVSIVYNGPIEIDDIFEKMEEQINGRGESIKFLEALSKYATDYAAIATPSHGKWADYDARVRRYVDDISQQIKMTFARPLMLAIASHFDPKEAHHALRDLLSWIVRFLIVGGSRSGTTSKNFGEAANAIKKGEIKTADKLAEHVKKVVPTDTRFQSAFVVKTLQNARQVRFILKELERQKRTGTTDAMEDPTSDTSILTLEHVLPKNLDAKGWSHIPVDEKRALRFRLGNQALMNSKDNGAIGDKAFSEKRAGIDKSKSILLTAEILESTKNARNIWDRKRITERQTMMAELAVLRWPLKGKSKN